ncbi:hypothetical protein THOG05_210012 [Vibrio rotiferianus]|nr:hypothetical protein THOG05_210012 [Vibrio rotiferianus]
MRRYSKITILLCIEELKMRSDADTLPGNKKAAIFAALY